MPASIWVFKTLMRNESESWDPCRGEHRRPDQNFCDGSAVERVCWDPKDGENDKSNSDGASFEH